MAREKLEQCLVDHLGIEVKEADPPLSLDVRHSAHELRQRHAAFTWQVSPPGNGVLGNQIQLDCACRDQALRFGDDVVRGARSLLTANLRNDADATCPITSLPNLEPAA